MARITKKKLYEEIADVISQQIKKGELTEGERLPSIQALAAEYGVGQASIREALNALRVMGLVDIRHGEGTFVAALEPKVFSAEMAVFKKKDIIDLLEVRKIIEIGAVRLAAQHYNDQQLHAIKTALDQMKEAMTNNELGEQSDLAFHMAIAEAANNQLLRKLLNDVSDVMKTTMKETRKIWIYRETKSIEKLYREHHDIYEAIAVRDEKRAERAMYTHLAEVEQVLIDNLKIE